MTPKVGGVVTERFPVRLLRGVLVAALIVMAGYGTSPAGAQEEPPPPPPLEDVTLRGRILRPDGKPLANTAVRVDAVKDQGFAFFAFFFTFGFSTLTCFDPASDACVIPNSKRYNGATDAHGNYSFTFPDAHRQGEQTNTDYYLSVAMPSKRGGGAAVVASYELELWDAVHDAPDLVLWDPNAKVVAGKRGYAFEFDARANSKNRYTTMIGTKPLRDAPSSGPLDARTIEDATVTLVPNASKDERAARTIYHQRFEGAAVSLKGTLVPLSRRAACTATRKDGTHVTRCGYIDADLVSPAVADPNPCRYFLSGERIGSEPCQEPVTSVTIDLQDAKDVGEVRARCSCKIEASLDRTTWWDLPAGELGAAQSLRYVRVTGESVAHSPEISVWPPWPDAVAPTPLATTPPTVAQDKPVAAPGTELQQDRKDDDTGRPWFLATVAVTALVLSGRRVLAARRA